MSPEACPEWALSCCKHALGWTNLGEGGGRGRLPVWLWEWKAQCSKYNQRDYNRWQITGDRWQTHLCWAQQNLQTCGVPTLSTWNQVTWCVHGAHRKRKWVWIKNGKNLKYNLILARSARVGRPGEQGLRAGGHPGRQLLLQRLLSPEDVLLTCRQGELASAPSSRDDHGMWDVRSHHFASGACPTHNLAGDLQDPL